MRFPDIKETLHHYKGFDIIGTSIQTEGGWVLGGRHYKEGGLKRNYQIKKDGKFFRHPKQIIEKLSFAKAEIDEHLNKIIL